MLSNRLNIQMVLSCNLNGRKQKPSLYFYGLSASWPIRRVLLFFLRAEQMQASSDLHVVRQTSMNAKAGKKLLVERGKLGQICASNQEKKNPIKRNQIYSDQRQQDSFCRQSRSMLLKEIFAIFLFFVGNCL